METSTIIVIVVLIIALLFFGITVISNNAQGSGNVRATSYPQYAGGGCGR